MGYIDRWRIGFGGVEGLSAWRKWRAGGKDKKSLNIAVAVLVVMISRLFTVFLDVVD
ncbi:hypothetical protein BDQ94DRAFT_145636, partial [Aspergillus welwitschiae]